MNRKEFIDLAAKTLAGLAIPNYLLANCIAEKEDLSKMIGENVNNLKNLKTEFHGKIACYSLLKPNIKIKSEKALLFTLEDKIVGFSLKIMDTVPKPQIIANSNTGKLLFNNSFGAKTVWKEGSTYKSLCIPKDYHDVEKFIFYSEYLEEASSFIW